MCNQSHESKQICFSLWVNLPYGSERSESPAGWMHCHTLLCQLLLWHPCEPLAFPPHGDAFALPGITTLASSAEAPSPHQMTPGFSPRGACGCDEVCRETLLLLGPDSAKQLSTLFSFSIS